MKKLPVFLICISVFILANCQSMNNASNPTNSNITGNQLPQPSPTWEPFIYNTSTPEKITLHGTLIVMNPMAILPSDNDALYLVPIPETDGVVSIPDVDVDVHLQSVVDERTGEFVFTNVEPGTYAIVVFASVGSELPAKFYNGGSLAIITVKETERGKTIELDDLVI